MLGSWLCDLANQPTGYCVDRETVCLLFLFLKSKRSIKTQLFENSRFAVREVEQAQTYWNLLEKVNPKELKLTKLDDEIYEHTMKTFPELAEPPHDKVTKIDEDWMKSEEGKTRWRDFMEV